MSEHLGVGFNDLINKALELGAEEAKIIDTETITVGHWVQLKCQYGCSLYDEDASHRPLAPGVEEMKELLKEYSKALLIHGLKGSALSKVAVKLEHEAVNQGYYKAFALISLPFGNSGST
ncbi:Predicted metal-binding protein [Candidatus Frackibacter sp. WG12]|nr:Predicted metal-binding protein [Candidatus Frackibacter sp. WG11]SEM58999.1 Predicted metal-binding protein [Candidatus Frackibacter sp. WG12]SFL63112.1 Predicted metal-binding protein [Candidatus Frackibacter sp. WG13]